MRKTLIALFAAAIVLAGCSTANLQTCTERAGTNERAVRDCRISAAFHQLEALNSDYEGIMIASGNARRQGFITDEQLNEVRKVGREAQKALETATDLLIAAKRANSDPRGVLFGVTVLLSDLARLAVTLGVK